jgi:hypothetical protein
MSKPAKETARTIRTIAACWSRARGEKPVMSKLAIAFVLAQAATATNAQDTTSGQSHTPAVPSAKGTRPFLFDGRMPGDGVRQGALADDNHPNAGPSSCHRKQASLGANDESAHPFTHFFHRLRVRCGQCGFLATSATTSGVGQNAKYLSRADVFRSCTDNGHRQTGPTGPFVPNADFPTKSNTNGRRSKGRTASLRR